MNCENNLPHILSLSPDELSNWFSLLYGKGKAHAERYLKLVYWKGSDMLSSVPAFSIDEKLIRAIRNDFPLSLPAITSVQTSESASKIVFSLADRLSCEAVLVKMSRSNTLCVSSQVGCGFGCIFCESGKSGLKRNLKTEEIVGQMMAICFKLKEKVDHIVFMGMGEPLDNFDAVIKAIDLFTLQWGLDFPMSSICISTAGYVPGILRLVELFQIEREKGYYRIRLAVSLNAGTDELRKKLMPVNRKHPLSELKTTLFKVARHQQGKALFIEYVLMPGINNTPDQVDGLARFCEGLPAGINIIPYNPGTAAITRAPEKEEIDAFINALAARKIMCRVRRPKGAKIMAGCGQLGSGAEHYLTP